MDGMPSALELLKRFHLLQQERVDTYDLFEEGFVAYLAGGPDYNFEMYKKLIHEITTTFKKISDEIITIQNNLATGYREISEIIGQIQDYEKLKLEDTAQLQICRQNSQDHPADESLKAKCADLNKRLAKHKVNICEEFENLKFESEDLMDET